MGSGSGAGQGNEAGLGMAERVEACFDADESHVAQKLCSAVGKLTRATERLWTEGRRRTHTQKSETPRFTSERQACASYPTARWLFEEKGK